MNTILCPHCGKQVEVSLAIKHQIEESIRKEEQSKYQKDLEQLKSTLTEKAKLQAKDELELKMKDSENELEESKKRNKELQEQLLELTKTMRDLREKDRERELEMQKKLVNEEEKIRIEAQKKAEEEQRLIIAEKEKKLQEALAANEEMKRKLTQGSQQTQGEVLELDLEEQLKKAFIFDEFLPIPKGIEGADIWQKVKNKHGQDAGSILWETKRTKTWSQGWLAKLREDTRKVNANISILVSTVLPDNIKCFNREAGIWITSYEYAILLSNVLRDSLLKIAIAKSSALHGDEKLQEIYEYICSEAFRHKFEAHFESVKTLKEDLESEKRAMERIWKKRETQLQRLDRSASQMFGELQGIAGSDLPSINRLELASPQEINE